MLKHDPKICYRTQKCQIRWAGQCGLFVSPPCSKWNISTNIGGIAIKFGTDKNPNLTSGIETFSKLNFGGRCYLCSSLIFCVAKTIISDISGEIPQQLTKQQTFQLLNQKPHIIDNTFVIIGPSIQVIIISTHLDDWGGELGWWVSWDVQLKWLIGWEGGWRGRWIKAIYN